MLDWDDGYIDAEDTGQPDLPLIEAALEYELRRRLYDQRLIRRALKETILAHGPIAMNWIGSAAKRISAHMRQEFNHATQAEGRTQPAEVPELQGPGVS